MPGTRSLMIVVVACLSLSGTSCLFRHENPSYFPYLLGMGPTVDTHAKPRGKGYFAQFDPHACRLEVRPLFGSVPVGTDQVILATIYDENDQPRRGRRVEWMLEGPGSIIEVDESGHLPGRGLKKDNKYAYSYTEYKEHTITRGNDNPNDDFAVRPGQSWCVISSPVEGQTSITVYAPEIFDWEKHKVVVRMNWTNAQWEFPPPVTSKTGSVTSLLTRVTRHSDRQPLTGYRVRYRLLDGPSAAVFPTGSQLTGTPQEAVAISDASGNAQIDIRQLQPQVGSNRVQVEILKSDPEGNFSVVAKSETKIDWQGPQLSVKVNVPKIAQLNQEVPVLFTVASTGAVEAQPMMLKTQIPPGFELVSASERSSRDGDRLIFALPSIPAGKQQTIQAVLRPTKLGKATLEASVPSIDGQRAQDSATIQVSEAKLDVVIRGPSSVIVGETIPVELTVSNPGNGSASKVKVYATLQDGLQPQGENPLRVPIETLAAGQSQTFTIRVLVNKAGRLDIRAKAEADGNVMGQAQPYQLEATEPQLTISTIGPSRTYVSGEVTWKLLIGNRGKVPLSDVVIRANLPSEVSFVSANQNGQVRNGSVIWSLGTAPPEQEIVLEVTAKTEKVNPKTFFTASASAEPLIERNGEVRPASMQKRMNVDAQELALEIQGVPAMMMEVKDAFDPIEVGKKSNYTIKVTNSGSLTSNSVEVTATIPSQFRPLRVYGPIQGRIDGQRVTFPPIDNVKPGNNVQYTIEVEAIAEGDARVRAELKSMSLTNPVRVEESTRVLPKPGSRPPPIQRK